LIEMLGKGIIGWFKRLGGRGRIRFNTSLECGLVNPSNPVALYGLILVLMGTILLRASGRYCSPLGLAEVSRTNGELLCAADIYSIYVHAF